MFNEKTNINNTVEGINKLVYVNQIVFSGAFALYTHTITFKAIAIISSKEPKAWI